MKTYEDDWIQNPYTHVADELPQLLRNARKLGVNFFETLLPGEHEMGLKKKFHRRKIF